MARIAKEKVNANIKSCKEDLDYQIEIATQTLDRNIGFITTCDNKTSIVLASFGVLLAIILTNEGLTKINNIVKTCIDMKSFCSILYLICFAGAIFVMMLGMFNLGRVLIARTSEKSIGRKDECSRIFFAGIRKNGDYKTYKQKFQTMNKKDILADLIEQIFINADIASTKYIAYNRGLKCTAIGFILFVVLLLIGICIY